MPVIMLSCMPTPEKENIHAKKLGEKNVRNPLYSATAVLICPSLSLQASFPGSV